MAAYAGKVGIDPDTVYMLVDRVRFNLQNECGSDLGMQNVDTIHCRRHTALSMFSSRSIDEGFIFRIRTTISVNIVCRWTNGPKWTSVVDVFDTIIVIVGILVVIATIPVMVTD